MDNTRTSELMNYELNGSNSNNYIPTPTSSSPESFPSQMENGIIIEYKEVNYASEYIDVEGLKDKQQVNNS